MAEEVQAMIEGRIAFDNVNIADLTLTSEDGWTSRITGLQFMCPVMSARPYS